MSDAGSVVPETSAVTEHEFHSAMAAGLARTEKRHGPHRLRAMMDVTSKQLGNIFKGSTPHPKRLFDVLGLDETALDEVAALYNKKLVHKDALLESGNLALLLAQFNLKLQEAMQPDSPGGPAIVHGELFGMEPELRDLHCALGHFIAAIDRHRGVGPR